MAHLIAIANQKGGVGKTTTASHIGIGLVREGKKVLLVDFDPQGSLSVSLGFEEIPDDALSISSLMQSFIDDETVMPAGVATIAHLEGVDLIPADITLSNVEFQLGNLQMDREFVFKTILEPYLDLYDYIIVDCPPSLSMLTINALTAVDFVIIPTLPKKLSIVGLKYFLLTVKKMRKRLNTGLSILGTVFTMVNKKIKITAEWEAEYHKVFDDEINSFQTKIPYSEYTEYAIDNFSSVFAIQPKSAIAEAYMNLSKEVIANAEA